MNNVFIFKKDNLKFKNTFFLMSTNFRDENIWLCFSAPNSAPDQFNL